MKFRQFLIVLFALSVAACDSDSGFVLPPANQVPTISAIADQSTPANGASNAIAFTVNDEDTSSLAIDVSSDNQNVIPDSGIVLGGANAQRSLQVTPVLDTTGDAFITVIVTDSQGLSASVSFLLTVEAQQVSILQFTRAEFAKDADGDPALVNALQFTQDADGDDFADLIAQ